MVSLQTLAELQDVTAGEQITVSALLTDIKVQTTSTGKDYVRLYFRDNKAATSIPLWNDTLESAERLYTIDKVYCIVASTNEYQGKTTIQKIFSATEVTDENILKRIKQHLYKQLSKDCIEYILAAVKALSSSVYNPYIAAIYGDGTSGCEKFQSLCKAYASINHHDNYPGGFLAHIGGMLKIAAYIKSNYLVARSEQIWDVDWVYITAAIMLHDIGKLETYSPITETTVRFKDDCLLDHNSIGVGILYSLHNSLAEENKLDYKTFQRMAYTIEYHDNPDKLYTHKFLEDKIISYIDGLEATLAVSCSLDISE